MVHSTSDIISSFENEQKNTVFSALSEYLSTGHFVDISLVCKGQILRAHKVVLSSSSKYFKDFFRHQPGVNIIDLDKELAPNDLSLTLEDVQLIIGILYCVGTVEISPQRIETLLICAQVLGIPTLISFLKKIRETLGDGGSKMIKEQPRTGIEYLDQCSRAGTSLLPTNILSPIRTSHKAVVPSVKSHNFPTPSRGVQQLPSRTGGVETPGQRESTEMMYLLPSPSGGTQVLGNFQGNHLGPSVLPPVGTRIAAPVHPRISATSGIGGSSRYTVGERRPSSSQIDLSVVKPLTASCINTPVPQEEQSMEKGLPSEQLLLRGRLRTEVSSTPSEKKQPLLGSSSSACHVQNPELAPEHSAGSSRRVQDSLLSCHKIDPDTVRGSMNLPRDTSASRISSASFSSFSGLGYLHSPRLKSAELPSGDAHTTGSLDGFDQNFLLTLSSLQANQIDDLENVLLPHLSMDVPRSESTLNNQLLDLHHMDEVEDNDISTTTPEGGATPCSVEGTVPTPCFNDHNHLEDNIPTSDDEDYSENDDDDSNNNVDHSVVANNQSLEDASHYSSMANQHTISNADNGIPSIGSNDNQKETTIMVKKVKSSSISDSNIFGNRKNYNDNNIMGESNELTVPQDGIKASELSLSPISETVSRTHSGDISVNCDEVYNGNQETRGVTRNMFNQEATPTRVSENVKLVDNQDDICSNSILSIKFIDKEKVYTKKDNNLRETNIEENLHHVQAKYNQDLIGAKRSLLTVQSQQIDAEYPSALLVSPSCPESPPQPVSTFRTVSTPQPVFTPQQVLPPQPVSSPHQEFSSQPSSTQLLSNPHPVVSPEQVSTPRTISTPRQVSTPRLVSTPRPISTPRPVSSPRLVLTPRPVSTPHPISTSLPVSSPRSSSSCRQILIPMTVSSPQSVPLPHPVSTPQPVSIPRPVSTPQPVTSPNPVSPSRPLSTPCPVSTHKPVPNPWPVLSPQPLQYPPPVTPIRITPDSLNSDRSDMTATPVRLTPHGGIALTPLKKLLQSEEADHEDCENVVNDVNIQSNSCNTINERSVEDDSIDEHDGGHNDDVDSDTEHSSEIVMNLDQVHEGQKMKFSIPGISQAVTVNFSVEALQEMKNAALKQTSCGNIPIETSDQYCEISSSNKIIKTNVASEVDPDTSTNKLLKRRKLKRNLRQKLKSNNKIAKSNLPESQETPNPIQYFCSLCNKTFLSHLQLEKHQKFHVRNCFCCELCQELFDTKWQYEEHMAENHDHAVNGSHQCEECGEEFSQRNMLLAHIQSFHMERKIFKCMLCDINFGQKHNLVAHMKSRHPKEANLICTACRDIFYDQLDMDSHDCPGAEIRNRFIVCHLHSKPINFTSRVELEKHMQIEHGGMDTNPFDVSCCICHKKFLLRKNLLKHVRNVHKQGNTTKHFCPKCGKQFYYKDDLKNHLPVHEGDLKYVCQKDDCTKAYSTEKALKKHDKNYHETDVTDVTCKVCQKQLSTKFKLKTHMLVHSDSKPFSCHNCNEKFKEKRNLIKHLKLKHEITGTPTSESPSTKPEPGDIISQPSLSDNSPEVEHDLYEESSAVNLPIHNTDFTQIDINIQPDSTEIS